MNVIEVLAKCKATIQHLSHQVTNHSDGHHSQFATAAEEGELAIAAIDTLPTEIGKISDGYHSFDDLYEHRFELWIALCRHTSAHYGAVNVYRCKRNADGTEYPGWFLLCMQDGGVKPMSYHLPIRLWDRCGFDCTVDVAPPFDGHTSADVLERLKGL